MKRAHPSPDTIFNQRQAWDAEYEAKGPLWGNIPLEPTTPNKQGLFVDLGCGNGKNLLKYHHDATKIGLDFSMQALYLCRKRNELSDVTLICADVKSLPFQDSCIHHIDAHHLLGHLLLQERMHAAQEISRCTHSRRCDLVVTVFATKDFRYRCGREVEDRTFMEEME
jgi:ubiquinone/menaquinone biosynthesis C-methylase UbiE